VTPPAAAAAPAVHPRGIPTPGRRTAPPRPRRVSGPARRRIDTQPQRPVERLADTHPGIAFGVLAALRGLSRAGLLDRLLRGRTWIALVAFALIGIVTLQLGLLKLNASIGRTLEKEAVLQRENASLSIENSELSAGDRVEARAVRLGMKLVPLGALRFLAARPHIDAGRGAAALSAPIQSASSSSEAPASGAAPASASSGTAGEESTGAQSTGAQSPAPSPSPSASETSTTSSESSSSSSSSSSTIPSSSSSSSPTASSSRTGASGAGSGSAEATTPAGGTQAGPTG
jgi:cell division protein FtsL